MQSSCICILDPIDSASRFRSLTHLAAMTRPANCTQRADLLGIACSAGCAVHCAAMPLVATAAPTLGLGWLSGSLVHQIVALVCLFFVFKAILPGWRQHQDRLVAACVCLGLSLLLLAAFVLPDPCCEPTSVFGWFGLPVLSVGDLQRFCGDLTSQGLPWVQPYLTPVGGVLLIAAHLTNFDLVRRQANCHRLVGHCLPSRACG